MHYGRSVDSRLSHFLDFVLLVLAGSVEDFKIVLKHSFLRIVHFRLLEVDKVYLVPLIWDRLELLGRVVGRLNLIRCLQLAAVGVVIRLLLPLRLFNHDISGFLNLRINPIFRTPGLAVQYSLGQSGNQGEFPFATSRNPEQSIDVRRAPRSIMRIILGLALLTDLFGDLKDPLLTVVNHQILIVCGPGISE